MNFTTRHFIDDVLLAIGQEGFSGLTVEATSLLHALTKLNLPTDCPPIIRERITHELRRQGLTETSKDGSIIRIQLSIKGMYRVQKSVIDRLEILEQDPWDGMWRIVMFDIPARHSQSRYLLTAQLKRLGFMMIQGSTWIHPYPCDKVLEQIITFTNLQAFVSYGTISQLDIATTRKLNRHFTHLSR